MFSKSSAANWLYVGKGKYRLTTRSLEPVHAKSHSVRSDEFRSACAFVQSNQNKQSDIETS